MIAQRRLLLVVIGIVAALTTGASLVATQRRHDAEGREAQALLLRTAEVLRNVLDESLEELRVREDARPYDQYNEVWRPTDVVAASVALAPSPLSQAPDDKRVLGWFQIDPGRKVRTPHDRSRTDASARIAAAVKTDDFSPLMALASPEAPQIVVDNKGYRTREVPPAAGTGISSLNAATTELYQQLKEAQAQPEKRAQLAQASKLPEVTRKNVAWEEKDLASLGSRSKNMENYKARPAPSAPPKGPHDGNLDNNLDASLNDKLANNLNDSPVADNAVVDYTPMVFERIGPELVLHRVVSSSGLRSVQGVMLDRAAILGAWLPAVIQRRVAAPIAPRVAVEGQDASCSLRVSASDVIDDVEFCFPSSALGVTRTTEVTESALLLVLFVIISAALYVLDRAARRSDELSRQKSAFISAISHELRTPLTTLRMHAELLRDDLVGPDKRRRFHDDMVRESVRLSQLVENVLEVSRLEEGRRPLRTSTAELSEMVAAVVEAQRSFVAARGFCLEVDFGDATLQGQFDRQAVEQIVVNLIGNAVKYAVDADERSIRIELQRDDGFGVLRVLDRGPGIPPLERERVFQRFARVERPDQQHVVGTGLGLYLVQELAMAHGGSARVTTRDGGGCCVEVRLPIEP